VRLTVRIEDVYSERVWLLEGTPRQVEAAILLLFPWLRSSDPADQGDLGGLLEDLASQ
jgi:hypothetical protein